MARYEGMKVKLLIGERPENRPCIVRDEKGEHKGLFHCWSHRSDVVDASPMMGGHPGGTVAFTVAIVELKDGSVNSYRPSSIRFLDTPAAMSQYCFEEVTNGQQM